MRNFRAEFHVVANVAFEPFRVGTDILRPPLEECNSFLRLRHQHRNRPKVKISECYICCIYVNLCEKIPNFKRKFKIHKKGGN